MRLPFFGEPLVLLLVMPASLLMGANPVHPTALFSTIASSPTSGVPGQPGRTFASLHAFSSAAASADGSRWLVAARRDTDLDLMLITGAGTSSAGSHVVAIENTTILPGTGGQTAQLLEATRMGINNSGQVAFAASTSTFKDVVVKWNGMELELIAHQDVQAVGQPLGVTYGTANRGVNITNDGQVAFASRFLGGNLSQHALFRNSSISAGTILAQAHLTVPAGQLTAPGQTVGDFDVHNFASDATGENHIYRAFLNGPEPTRDVVVVNGQVVMQQNHPVPGFANPAPLLAVHSFNSVQMSKFNGHYIVRGSVNDGTNSGNATDFVFHDGRVVAATGMPIFPGASEVWDDLGHTDTFYMALTNSAGDYIVSGITGVDGPFTKTALVLNGLVPVARTGDPIDLNGDGVLNDDAFISSVATGPGIPGIFTDAGYVYFTANVRNGAGAGLGTAFLVVQVPEPSVLPLLLTAPMLAQRRRRVARRQGQ